MSSKPTITAIIITKNEEENIRSCLESIAWADEVIVFDSGSTDKTVTIVKEFTNNVFITDWPGYGAQKNRALEKATSDWIISIDADERVSEELREEMEQAVSSGSHAGFKMPRLSSYCGRFLKHGGWWPDYVTRLARREACRFSDSIVHESLLVDGQIGTLSNPIKHYTYRTMDDVTMMIHRYSSASAQMMYEKGKSASLFSALTHSFWSFIRSYIFRLGLLEGKEGLLLAISSAEYTFHKYVKLSYLSKN